MVPADREAPQFSRADQTYDAEPLSQDEVDALIDACKTRVNQQGESRSEFRYPTGARDAAMIAVMAFAGLRVGEVVRLDGRDFDPKNLTLHIRKSLKSSRRKKKVNGRSKRTIGRARMAGLSRRVAVLLNIWLEFRNRLDLKNSRNAPLFCHVGRGREGEPLYYKRTDVEGREVLDTGLVRMMVQRKAAKARIQRRVTPHSLRHTFAKEWIRSGRSLPMLQKALGHAGLEVTAHYTSRHFGEMDVAEAMAGFDWE